MNLVRWEPFREIMSLRDAMDRLFEDSFVRAPCLWPRLGGWELPIERKIITSTRSAATAPSLAQYSSQ